MAKEVYRVRFSNGQEHDWHNTPDALRREDSGAVILARRVENAQREGVYVPYEGKQPEPAVLSADTAAFDSAMREASEKLSEFSGQTDDKPPVRKGKP